MRGTIRANIQKVKKEAEGFVNKQYHFPGGVLELADGAKDL